MNTITPAESVDTNATPEAQQAAAAPATEATPAPDQESATAVPEAKAAAASRAPAAKPAGAGLSPRALLKQLQQDYPAFRDCLPLSIGIDKQLLARMPGLDRKVMRAALGIHTGSMRYLRAMEKAKVRYDLDGTPGAEVPDTHRAHAKEQLQQRFKKEAERKKAERDAAAAEEANRLRQEKLQALASKFSKN
ncbi:ProQ/FINO family protein [Massilia sp. YIM B02443]|uniref:ProQ/FINO family protein n=1 Tax=Massilia sp. YIM B02443 TaxID=3050127 RepID=UPI0025B690BC|nr:ProQ/FINO family protein [Massilia sp. YIM B02443]MDN4038321.1 ProQ/FINO family protein [Massilia sp. YIM B02443]